MIQRIATASNPDLKSGLTFDAMSEIEPLIGDVEYSAILWAARRHRPGDIWFAYEGFKAQLSRYVGWHAKDVRLSSSRCYEAAISHVLAILESSEGAS